MAEPLSFGPIYESPTQTTQTTFLVLAGFS
jgi:hypothetical protein